MMQTTCVDEERIQRVDSTYLYLQNKKKEFKRKKNAKKKIAIYTTLLLKNKKNSTSMPFGSRYQLAPAGVLLSLRKVTAR